MPEPNNYPELIDALNIGILKNGQLVYELVQVILRNPETLIPDRCIDLIIGFCGNPAIQSGITKYLAVFN